MSVAPQAFYFGPPDRPLMGFWHSAIAPVKPLAVVLVGPWGIEGMNLQRTWRQFAQDLAAQGFPVLRFDLDGCGDSHSPADETDLWPLWNASLTHAKQAALVLSRLDRVALVGFRLGALLAAHHADQAPDHVCGVVALAPPRSGQALIRELKMLEASTQATPAPPPLELVAAGFGMSKATAASIKKVKLPDALAGLPVALVDREEAPIGQDWTQKLSVQGSTVTYAAAAGYPGMQRPAYEVVPAKAFFELASASLQNWATSALPTGAQGEPGLFPFQTTASMPCRANGVEEWATPPFHTLGMVAIVVRPTPGTTLNRHPNRAVLVLNSSSEHRVGPNRFWVDWARQLASEGMVVVRLDLPGIGESDGDGAPAATQVYRSDAITSVCHAMDWLGLQLGVREWALVGLCSGAYHAIGTALCDERVRRVVAINPLVFTPASVQNLDLSSGTAMQHLVAAKTLQSAKDPQRWLRLMRGQANTRLIIRSVLGRAGAKLAKRTLDLGRSLKLWPATPLANQLTAAVERGCRFHFVFESNDPGWAILKEDIGSLADQMLSTGGFTRDTISEGGHSFVALAGRYQMLAITAARTSAWFNTRD